MHDDAVLAALQRISAQLDALPRAIVAAQRAGGNVLTKADRKALETLLPAIAASVGSDYMWTTKELVAHAKEDAALLVAIEAASGRIDGGTARRLGKRLRRANNGITLDGHRIERVGAVRDGVLYAVRV